LKVIKQVVRLTVNLTINEGQTEAFNSISKAMVEVTRAEPGTLGYEWFAHGDGKRFTLLETYIDTAAIEAHFMGPAVQVWVPKTCGHVLCRRVFHLWRPGTKGGRHGWWFRRGYRSILDGD
jgi:quinol monooxygenase YgiN